MKAGLTITEMAKEIERQASAKADYLVNPQKLEMESLGGLPMLRVVEDGVDQMEPLSIQETAHRQIGAHLGIPWKYYEKMLQEEPGLLSHNVNHWLRRGEPAQRMLRTLDGKARAFLSNRYRPIDNLEITAAEFLKDFVERYGAKRWRLSAYTGNVGLMRTTSTPSWASTMSRT